MLHDSAQKTLKEDSHEQKALRKALSRFGVLLSLTQVSDVVALPKAQAIRILLDMYDAGHRPITEDLVRQVHHAFIEEFVCLAGESNGFKSLL